MKRYTNSRSINQTPNTDTRRDAKEWYTMSENSKIFTIDGKIFDFSKKNRLDYMEEDIEKLKEDYNKLVKAHNELRIEMESIRYYFTNDWAKYRKTRLYSSTDH